MNHRGRISCGRLATNSLVKQEYNPEFGKRAARWLETSTSVQPTKKKKGNTVIRAYNVLSFNRAPSPPPSSIVHGPLSTLFIILEGITPCQFRTANPLQDWSVTIKVSYLDFKFNASGLSQPMKCQICDADAAWLCTVWTQMFGHKWKKKL